MELTREIVLSEPAGRRLDSWIAEKVMGWKERVDFDYVNGIIVRYIPGTNDVKQFEPSIDISAAWEVVEKMNETHWFTVANGISKGSARCTFGRYGVFESPAVFSDSAPEAICKAALLAVMEGDETA